MTKTATLQRLELLYLVLQFCTYEQENGRRYVFNPFERIAINQERGARFEHLSFLDGNPTSLENEIRIITTSDQLEEKIAHCRQQIVKRKWYGYPQSYFLEY